MKKKLPLSARLRRAVTNLKIIALRTACRIGGPRFAARFILRNSDWKGFQPGRPTVVALKRPLFSKDLVELRKRTNINWIFINNEFLAHVQSAWIPREMQVEADYQRYRDGQYQSAWEKLEEFGVALIQLMRERAEIDAFMTSHIDYWHAEGVRLGARKTGIPFLGLCREHMCLPIEQQSVTEFYKGFTYEGDAIAVFGEATRKIFINSGACKPEQVVVTGPPRLDIWRDITMHDESGDYLVLLSYRDPDYRAPESFAEVLNLFVNCAIKHHSKSDAKFLVKAKNREDEEEIRGMAGKLTDNIIVDHEIDLPTLFPRSRLIVGFNSLSVLEAHFTNAKIVVPYWGDARRHTDELIFNPDDQNMHSVINFPETQHEFSTLLDDAISQSSIEQTDRDERLAVINEVFHFPSDRTCSEEVEAFVRNHIKGA